MEAPTDTPVLPYGVESPLRRRRRRVIALAVFLMLAIVPVKYGVIRLAPYWLQAQYLRQQYHVSHQVLAPGTIVYTEDPARIASLRNRPDYRDKRATVPPHNEFLSQAWERTYSNDDFRATYAPLKEGNFQVNDTFGYLRTSKGGKPWIVHLDQVNPYQQDYDHGSPHARRMVGITQSAFSPAGWTAGSRAFNVSYMSRVVRLDPDDRITLFAPQPDPADVSRINVSYELNGQPGLLKAIITDNGYVEFTNDTGPANVVKWNDWGDTAK